MAGPPSDPCNAPGRTIDHTPLPDGPGDTLVPADGAAAGRPAAAGSGWGYDLLGELGRGGMGVVYKARHRALNRLVALKMVLAGDHAGAADRARFRLEAETVARLRHPNIVQIFDVGERDGHPYLALELIDGPNLGARLAGTPQPARPAAHLTELLARAAHFAHSQGVVHRDLKPANVLLAAPGDDTTPPDPDAAAVARLYGVPKVTDFGLAKQLDADSGHTRTGDVLGTPSYMAPEQAAGRTAEVGPAADVYALGAILYELLTGRPPFRGASPLETLNQVLAEDPVPPGRLRPKLPRDLERICLKCLFKDPRRRYESAAALAADLSRHLAGESVHARPTPAPERLLRWARRNPAPASLLVAISIGAGVGFWHLSELSERLVESSALAGAAQQTELLGGLNKVFTKVAGPFPKTQVAGGDDWQTRGRGPDDPPPIPAPTTLTIELCKWISETSRRDDRPGVEIRLYSDYPFRNRTGGGVRDAFERRALDEFAARPDLAAVHEFGPYGPPGAERWVLRYATPRRMERGCVDCHARHPDSPKTDWKVGDVRGVLEIVRPLDEDRERVRAGLRATVGLVAGVGVTLVGVSGVLLALGGRRRLRTDAAPPPTVTPAAPPPAIGMTVPHPLLGDAGGPSADGETIQRPEPAAGPPPVAGETPEVRRHDESPISPARLAFVAGPDFRGESARADVWG